MLELEKWEGKIAENEPDIEAMLAGAMRYKIAAARTSAENYHDKAGNATANP